MTSKDAKNLILIITAAIAVLAFLRPFGNYPLNDDWVQTLSIQEALKGHLYYPPWLSTYALVPIFYGLIASKVFGFSFAILRLTNFGLAILSLVIFYALVRKDNTNEKVAIWATLVLAANPLFIHLACTFMTDIPALFFILLAALTLTARPRLSAFATSLGFLTRQVPVLFLASSGLHHLRGRTMNLRRATYLFGGTLLTLIALHFILKFFGFSPQEVTARFAITNHGFFKNLISNSIHLSLLIGLFLSPLAFSYLESLSRRRIILISILGLTFAFITARANFILGGLGNLLTQYGLGAYDVMQGDKTPLFSKEILYSFHFLSAFSFVALFDAFLRNRREFVKPLPLFSLLNLLLILPIRAFDRYLLLILPGLILALPKKRLTILPKLAILTMLSFSLITTYNYLRLNDARWALLNTLKIIGIEDRKIDGGYEWVGSKIYQTYNAEERLSPKTPLWAPWYIHELTPGHRMEYIVGFSPLGGYAVTLKLDTQGIFQNIKTLYVNEVRPKSLKGRE